MQFEMCKWENSRSSEQKSNSNCDGGLVVSYSSSISKPFHRIQQIYLWNSLKNDSSVKHKLIFFHIFSYSNASIYESVYMRKSKTQPLGFGHRFQRDTPW